MRVVFLSAALRGLRRMPRADAAALTRKLETCAETGRGDVRKLRARDGWRLQHGNWRAIFRLEGDVIVVEIAHRREIYD